jgi:predicted ferric reductase
MWSRFCYWDSLSCIIRLHGSSVSAEEHPFSIASSPSPDGRISLTIKEIGDFTSTVGSIKPGDEAVVHGPFGRISHVFHSIDDDLVFVAAGIGITPLMSMLRYMRDRRDSRRVMLFYANRGTVDIAFRSELESIESGGFPALNTTHILSRPPDDWVGPTSLTKEQKEVIRMWIESGSPAVVPRPSF